MKVLLIGGTGTLSSDTTQLCVDRGFDVFLFNRGNKNTIKADNLHCIIGDINDVTNAEVVLDGLNFDVVVDYLTYNVETLKKRINVFSGKTLQYIFISSATVFPGQEEIITEKSKIGNDGWTYSKNKRMCEEYLKNNMLPFEYTIVRPYITYDIKRIPFPIISKKSCWNLLYRINNNLPILMCGDGKQKMTLTNTKDFAVGIAGLFSNGQAYGEDFNIVGDNVYEWNEVIDIIEKCLGKKATVIYVPTDILSKELVSIREELLYDKSKTHIFDNRKLKKVVPEFESKIDLNSGLSETLTNLMNASDMHVLDNDWNAMEDVLCRRHGEKRIRARFGEYLSYFNRENRNWNNTKKKIKKLVKC